MPRNLSAAAWKSRGTDSTDEASDADSLFAELLLEVEACAAGALELGVTTVFGGIERIRGETDAAARAEDLACCTREPTTPSSPGKPRMGVPATGKAPWCPLGCQGAFIARLGNPRGI
jgi:hypothetical protein